MELAEQRYQHWCAQKTLDPELRQELAILGRYVEIQRIRLSDSFTFAQDVPDALLSCLVPKMMLQPLAENAILHGLSGV